MEVEKSNVINLPTFINPTREYNARACIEFAKDTHAGFCDDVTDFAMESVIATLQNFGVFQDAGRQDENDFKLVEQAINSMLYRYYNIEHPLHNMVDTLLEGEETEIE